jgi:DNA helicase-2/ATP-dependent DNA helicase PcrA
MKAQFKAELNDRQYQAVETVEGPVLIIAGAGSGKTRVITYRIANMLSQGIPQSSILALTFTNKAAREMENRIKEFTKKRLTNLTISTFHAFGVKVLKENIRHLGYRDNFTIYDQTDKISLIKETARHLCISTENIDAYQLSLLFSNIKTSLVQWDSETEQFRKMYDEYQEHLKLYNAVDFEDLITLPIELFNDHPAVLDHYRDKFKYIMVDEFQDTSSNQYEIIRLLGSVCKNVCVVGDDDQSIYSWRGANYENIMRFERDFPEFCEIKLERNYRSTMTILTAANGVIAHNKNRKSKNLWTPTESDQLIELYFPMNEREEAEFIAENIKIMRIKENRPFDDFGVLIRTNSLTRSIEEAFMNERIPYRVSGGTSFFQRQEIKDVICYLRIINNPDDDVSLLRIINTPRRGIGKTTLQAITDLALKDKISLYSAMTALKFASDSPFSDKIKRNIDDFLELVETQREKFSVPKNITSKTRELIDSIEYWGHLVADNQKNDKAARWKYRNIEYFISSIEDWEKDPDNLDTSLGAFLNRITLITRDDLDENEDSGKVNLMTIHASKGLEFNIVFLAGIEDGIVPHARAIEESETNIEEERRLFYVAITRAREKLIISSCRTRRQLRDVIESSPSPFLSEIPDGLIVEKEIQAEQETGDYFSKIRDKFKILDEKSVQSQPGAPLEDTERDHEIE